MARNGATRASAWSILIEPELFCLLHRLRSLRRLLATPAKQFVDGRQRRPASSGSRCADFQMHVRGKELCVMKGFKPLHDRVLVRRVEAEEKTAGGIIIPDTVMEKPVEGSVKSVGFGARRDGQDCSARRRSR